MDLRVSRPLFGENYNNGNYNNNTRNGRHNWRDDMNDGFRRPEKEIQYGRMILDDIADYELVSY